MEPSTSQTQAPDTVAKVTIRARPQIEVAPLAPLSKPTWIQFRHPAIDLPFLRLPALDHCPPAFGVHYGTAIAACQILACNKEGYLSTSAARDDGYVSLDADSVITHNIYYYHLKSLESEKLYQICCDFSCWEFPHLTIPRIWKNQSESSDQTPVVWASNWSAISANIKGLDRQCLVSESKDSLTTCHIVPKIHEPWLIQNNMEAYLPGDPLHSNPCNLFTLRWDLYLGQFDEAGFVIVPKCGQLVVHFLQPTNEVAQQYHNVHFDHKSRLSHEALYARFAWALMKNAKQRLESMKHHFRFLTAPGAGDSDGGDGGDGGDEGDEGGDGGNKGSGDGGDKGGGGDKHGPSKGGPKQGSSRTKGSRIGGKRKRDEVNEDDEPHHDTVVSDADPQEDTSQMLFDNEAEELAKDMKLAACTLPFFLDPNGVAEPGRYETLPWYPGMDIVERKKKAYLDAHPEIRAHSSQVLPDEYSSSDDEDPV